MLYHDYHIFRVKSLRKNSLRVYYKIYIPSIVKYTKSIKIYFNTLLLHTLFHLCMSIAAIFSHIV